MIQINFRDPRPIYEQVKAEFRRLIHSEILTPGTKLPSVRDLAAQLVINPNTIHRAYRELEAEGYILSIAGKGSFVADVLSIDRQKRQECEAAFMAAVRELRALGYDTEAITALLQKEETP